MVAITVVPEFGKQEGCHEFKASLSYNNDSTSLQTIGYRKHWWRSRKQDPQTFWWECEIVSPLWKQAWHFSYSLKQIYYVTQQISPYSPTQKQTPPTQKHGFGSHFHNSPRLEATGNVHWPTEGQYNDPPLPTSSLCVITIVNHNLGRQMENSREREFWSLKLHPVLGHTTEARAVSLHPRDTHPCFVQRLRALHPAYPQSLVHQTDCGGVAVPVLKVLLPRSVVSMRNNDNCILVYWSFMHRMCVCVSTSLIVAIPLPCLICILNSIINICT